MYVHACMQEEELVDGKVDWRGRRAVRHKHGGMKVSLLVLGNLRPRISSFSTKQKKIKDQELYGNIFSLKVIVTYEK